MIDENGKEHKLLHSKRKKICFAFVCVEEERNKLGQKQTNKLNKAKAKGKLQWLFTCVAYKCSLMCCKSENTFWARYSFNTHCTTPHVHHIFVTAFAEATFVLCWERVCDSYIYHLSVHTNFILETFGQESKHHQYQQQ